MGAWTWGHSTGMVFSAPRHTKKTQETSSIRRLWFTKFTNSIILVGGLEHFLFFHSVGNVIIPTDELHHFSEGLVNHQPDIIWLSYGYCMVSIWLLYVIITIAIDIHWLSSLEKYPGISHSNWWIFETFPNFSSRTSKLSACPGQSVAVARLEGDNQPMPLSARQSLPVPPGSPRCNSPVSSCLIIRPYWCNVSLVN